MTWGNGKLKLGARSDGPCRFLRAGRFDCGRLWFLGCGSGIRSASFSEDVKGSWRSGWLRCAAVRLE